MCLFEKFADRLIIVSTAIHNPRQQKKEKCVCGCATLCVCVFLQIRRFRRKKKKRRLLQLQTLELSWPVIFFIAYGNESGMLRRAHRPSKRQSPGV